MKKIFVLILMLSFVFSGSFPQHLSELDLGLFEVEGDLDEGVAYYSTPDDKIMAIINVEKMSLNEWENFASFYEEVETNKRNNNEE